MIIQECIPKIWLVYISFVSISVSKVNRIISVFPKFWLLGRRQSGPVKSVLLVIIGWLVGWQRSFLRNGSVDFSRVFWLKLGDDKSRKFTEPDFCKKFLIWRDSQKHLQINSKSVTLIFFSKTTLTIFLVSRLKLVNETYFSEKSAISRYLTSKSSKVGCFLTIRRSSQCNLVSFLIFLIKDV